MSQIFVDTSAILPVLDRDAAKHPAVSQIWNQLLMDDNVLLVSTNYVLLESFTLLQNRWGMQAVTTFHDDILPVMEIEWVNESLHERGISAMLIANRRKLSLVDCVSFEICWRRGIDVVLAIDQHFVEQGFTCLA